MEYYSITKTDIGLHIDGFPDAIKLLKLDSPKAKRLADLGLHKHDLDFALECLEGVNQVAEEPYALRQGLWRAAIIHLMKCFGDSESRFSLNPDKVYKNYPGAKEPFEYFKALRNKHLIHDGNSYSQCIPGAVLNKQGLDCKIAKIMCPSFIGDTLDKDSYNNLHLLITHALDWVVKQFDELCDILTGELESESYEKLLQMDEVTYSKPKIEDIEKSRHAP